MTITRCDKCKKERGVEVCKISTQYNLKGSLVSLRDRGVELCAECTERIINIVYDWLGEIPNAELKLIKQEDYRIEI